MVNKEELFKKAKYILFPNNERYVNHKDFPIGTVLMPIVENSIYKTYSKNKHHFKPFYHINYVLPILNKILDFNYNIDDFNLIQKDDNGYDLSYLSPKKEYKFDIYDLTDNITYFDFPFAELRTCRINDSFLTPYHRLFAVPHRCSHIINKDIDNSRVLLISCDSQMIPIIPVLSCYFKEIWCFDNRDKGEYFKNVEIEKITDALFAGGFNEEKKYFNDNLK